MSSIFEQLTEMKKDREAEARNEAKVKVKEIIKELIDTSWSGDNESQMKAVQLLKGIALSDDPAANAFMKKLDKFTSGMKMDEAEDKKMDKLSSKLAALRLEMKKSHSALDKAADGDMAVMKKVQKQMDKAAKEMLELADVIDANL